MRIIGIDPGLARVGYGIIEMVNERKILLDCGVIETGKDKKEEDRLYEIFPVSYTHLTLPTMDSV